MVPAPFEVTSIIFSKIQYQAREAGHQWSGAVARASDRVPVSFHTSRPERAGGCVCRVRPRREPESDNMMFFKSLLPYVQNIPSNRKLRFRSKILDTVDEFSSDYTPTSWTSAHYVTTPSAVVHLFFVKSIIYYCKGWLQYNVLSLNPSYSNLKQ